ncbi:MAG TPA: CRTAC1 family protein, partial [bacterium]|nr:CRTAC1 family protein [bacterium]
REAGLDFRHENGAAGRYRLFEIMGSGGGFLDHDGDGDLDVFLVQCDPEGDATSRLYRNDGGRFADVTGATGADVPGAGMGCAAADWDRDGDTDLYVTRVGHDVALRNEGDGTFRDVTAEAGLGTSGFSSSAAFLDHDGDGWLDLYVVRYVDVAPGGEHCSNAAGQRDYCNPTAHRATTDVLYRNRGDGTFEDVSGRAGIAGSAGYGLALCCHDFDGDGDVDVYVANDQSPAFLWVNAGDGTFREDALVAGCAYNDDGAAIAGMGTATGDLDDDGDLDLLVTNIREEPSLFLRNDGGSFADHGWSWGSPGWLRPHTGFGLAFLDQDLDGALDLFVANGSVVAVPSPLAVGSGYRQPNQFLRRDASGRFVDAGAELTDAIRAPAVSRGVALGDWDDDGDPDLLVTRNGDRPQLLRNDGTGHWLGVAAVESEGSAPAVNARVTLETAGTRQVRESIPQQSYLCSSDPRVHFGLGRHARVDRIVVTWPDGATEAWGPRDADRYVRLVRGTGEPVTSP